MKISINCILYHQMNMSAKQQAERLKSRERRPEVERLDG